MVQWAHVGLGMHCPRTQDSKDNTPLHYAAGYGRGAIVEILLEAGSNVGAKNATGKTPLDLIKLSEENPLNKDEDIVYKLQAQSA